MDSRISGFYKGTPEERRQALLDAGVEPETVESLRGGALGIEGADAISENVVGTLEYPIGIATNFVVDGDDTLVPMAIEETRPPTWPRHIMRSQPSSTLPTT